MLTAHYIGDHAKDGLATRTGWWLTRVTQSGVNKCVTHCEAIHKLNTDGSVTIASSSLRDGGVRAKENVNLNAAHWMIVDVPVWSVAESIEWFAEHDGELYDLRGAIATVLPGPGTPGRKFCNQAVGESAGVVEARTFGPALFTSMCLSFGKDITRDFFNSRTTGVNA